MEKNPLNSSRLFTSDLNLVNTTKCSRHIPDHQPTRNKLQTIQLHALSRYLNTTHNTFPQPQMPNHAALVHQPQLLVRTHALN